MKALVALCERSIVYRLKELEKEKNEECEEDKVEKAIYDEEDECDLYSDEDDDDEDYDCNQDLNDNLYDSKFDQFDEVIYFRDVFTQLEQ